MLSSLNALFFFIVTLGVLVTFHEWGHFIAARKLGVKVLKFSVGFGKPIWKRVGKDGVEYIIAWIPLGGYVKLLGESDSEYQESDAEQALNRQPVWKRNVIYAAGPFANFVLAFVVFWLMYMVGIEMLRPAVGYIEPNSIVAEAGMKNGDEITGVDGKPVSTWEEVSWALARRMGDGENILLSVKGNERTSIRDIELNTADWKLDDRRPDIMRSLGLTLAGTEAIIGEVSSGSAGEAAGLRVGDRVISVGGNSVRTWNDITKVMSTYESGELALIVSRDTNNIEVYLTPKKQDGRFLIGIAQKRMSYEEYKEKYIVTRQFGPLESINQSLTKSWEAMTLIGVFLKKLVIGEVSTKSLGGPISIAENAGSSARIGLVYFLGFLGMISINLGLINLLPVPMLDGGQILFNFIESIKGQPLSESVQEIWLRIGGLMVLALMVLAFFNDIVRVM